MGVTHDHLSGMPPGNGNSRGSQEQASSPQTRRAGAHRHDKAPVTPPTAAPHVEAAVLTLVAGAAVVVVGSTGHLATGIVVRIQGLRQVEFNACEAMVVGHDGFRVQVRVTKETHTRTGNSRKESECRPSGEANNKHGPPATAPAEAAAGGPTNQQSHTPEDRTQSRTCQTHCQGTGTRCLECGTLGPQEEIKRAYK